MKGHGQARSGSPLGVPRPVFTPHDGAQLTASCGIAGQTAPNPKTTEGRNLHAAAAVIPTKGGGLRSSIDRYQVHWVVRSETGSENALYRCQRNARQCNQSQENKGTSNQNVALITQRSRVQIPPPQPLNIAGFQSGFQDSLRKPGFRVSAPISFTGSPRPKSAFAKVSLELPAASWCFRN